MRTFHSDATRRSEPKRHARIGRTAWLLMARALSGGPCFVRAVCQVGILRSRCGGALRLPGRLTDRIRQLLPLAVGSGKPPRRRKRSTGFTGRKSAWLAVAVAGTLGLALMLCLQLSTEMAAADADPQSGPTVSRRAITDDREVTEPQADRLITSRAQPIGGNDDESWEMQPNRPFAETEADPFAQPPTGPTEDPPTAIDSSGGPKTDEADIRPIAPAPLLELDVQRIAQTMTTNNLDPGRSMPVQPDVETDRLSGRSPFPDVATDDGWRPPDASPSERDGVTGVDRTLLEVPDLIVPKTTAEDLADAIDVRVPLGCGPRELNVSVTREAPSEAVIHQPIGYRILVTNRGGQTIDRVLLEEQVPAGHRVIGTLPSATRKEGNLRWLVRDLKPGDVRTFRVQVVPAVAGAAIGVARVKPFAAVTAETQSYQSVKRPPAAGGSWASLPLEVSAPSRVTAGEACVLHFTATNTTSRPLTDLILRVVLPDELVHRHGRSLDHPIRSLRPGETHRAQLTVEVQTAGTAVLAAALIANGDRRGQAKAIIVIPTLTAENPAWPELPRFPRPTGSRKPRCAP